MRGNERAQKLTYVRRHDGSVGCSVAQLREVMSGCARLVRGATASSDDGSVGWFGKRAGGT